MVDADGVDNGCHIVAAEKPKRPYPDPSVLLATFKFKPILSNQLSKDDTTLTS